ncbi:6488ab51-7959-4435-beb4-c9f449663e35-CDS [Sclerotinia trifoliorum]|uniref:6488ab51-7959-4435-beb4-c9f449663e35-CDS n=1 Tax=Sclerotinia trifoliorum TaxID=28548 RepID=A0A8H2W175_9HELO|nr:6488ab51-7959-4435-beb4-c9f449663e35-CDS [Sclerotinia trifoliorum]
MHHTRHKEILNIIREIKMFDQENQSLDSQTMKRKDGPEKKRTDSETTSEATDAISEMSFEEESLTRRERKKAKKLGARTRRNVDVYSQDEINSISEALHGQIHESKGAWEGTYAYDNRRADASLTNNDVVQEEDEEYDVYAVQSPHPASNKEYKVPNYPTPKQQRAAKKLTTTTNLRQSKLRGHQQKFTPEMAHKNDPYGGIDPAIMYRLGIDVNPLSSPKTRKELIEKLIIAVKNDLQVIRREEEEAVIREEGFWRWAGRNAFRNILEYRKTFDWATGQKISAMKTEAEIFGDGSVDGQVGGDGETHGSYGTIDGKGEDIMDEIIPVDSMVDMEILQGAVEESELEVIDKKCPRVKKEIRVLKITTAYESHLKQKPRLTKSISKISFGKKKQVWKCFEAQGFVDNSLEEDDEMAQDGLDDLIRFKNSGINTPVSSTWAAVVGYSSNGNTITANRAKKATANRKVITTIEDEEWTTVTKKGKKN